MTNDTLFFLVALAALDLVVVALMLLAQAII